MAESEELKSLLMKVKEESEKVGLKFNRKLRSWHPVPSLHGKEMGKQWKQWQALFSWAPVFLQMVTAAMKLNILAPWKKCYNQPRQYVKKQRHYFANKGPSSQSYDFPVVIYGCESWTIKKAEHRRIDAFELWCWRRFLRVHWTARRSNQSILKEISLECSLEGLMLKLKFQYFGHLMQRTYLLEKTLMLGGIGGRRRRER